VKVHGSVSDSTSMVDLASQKVRGLSADLRRWLSRTFSEHPLLVVGFSGADLEFHDDYFGLEAAMPFVPWLRWTDRGNRAPLDAARALVATARDGDFLRGPLPDSLGRLGIPIPAAHPAVPRPDLARRIESWLGHRGAPFGCAVFAARILAVCREPSAKQSVARFWPLHRLTWKKR
jgi:hypothetical protein